MAISFVINYEEGSEYSVGAGDEHGEVYGLTYPFPSDRRNLRLESEFEYGSRLGIWRLLDVFESLAVPVTFHASAVAVAANPDLASAIRSTEHEVCAHGWRWEEAWRLSEAEERERIARAYEALSRLCKAPVGWYSRYGPTENTRRLLVDDGRYVYDSDAYNDDLPYWVKVGEKQHLVVPYSAVYNDMRPGGGSIDPEAFLSLLRRALHFYIEEGANVPRLMTIGLHPRISGHAAQVSVLAEFAKECARTQRVWFARRMDVAQHWVEHVPLHDTR